MKKGIIFLGLCFVGSIAMATSLKLAGDDLCKAFFIMETGKALKYQSYNSKDKVTGSDEMMLKELKSVDGGTEFIIHQKTWDQKDKLVHEDDLSFSCKNGVFTMSMENYMTDDMAQIEGMEISIEQSGLAFPSSLAVGSTLPDGSFTMKASSGGATIMTVTVEVVERKVEALEKITTPAGTFDAIRLSETQHTKMAFMNKTFKSKVWIVEDLGAVRTESYDQKDKLQSYRQLVAIN